MHRRVIELVVLVLVLAAGAGSLAVRAGAAPNAPAVPAEARVQARAFLKEIGGSDLVFFPTRLPTRYAYQSYSVTGAPLGLDLAFIDPHYTSNATKIHKHEITFDVGYQGKAPCSSGSHGVFRVGGLRLFRTNTMVWRCVQSAGGKKVKESATGNVGAAKLAVLVASARPG